MEMRCSQKERRADRSLAVAGTSKTKAPEQTFEEVRYLRNLSEKQVVVRARLTDNSEVEGTVEFYDVDFIRLTRDGEPNLFLYKHDIKYLYEKS
jgi:host factor-I protein